MEVQIPHLCGVVLDDKGCCCIGMLLSWIDCQYRVHNIRIYTRGWVERETVGTVEGDQQGLQKIKSFLLGQDNKANYGELLARLRVTQS
uniref:Uncharacterized protein n=1 Tax=Coccidioides posadasii RMSCC 3488 TaxID=454284 RepID=A0A0J6FQP8_COCPO|nr:hypothetical protein CPAG_07646 [Coccidioides posadasii RMSCC 3488]